MHRPISFKGVSLCFPTHSCFDDFSASILFGSRIAIIGRNGSGKSSLLKMLAQKLEASSGCINIPKNLRIAHVEQIITEHDDLSGGERFNKQLSTALGKSPNLLLLDEPTNHLDANNRKRLMRLLKQFQGTLIVVTHDTQLLRCCVDTLWHIHENHIHIVHSSYDDYIRESKQRRSSIEKEISALREEKKSIHQTLMQEQERASKSKRKGQKSIKQRKWPTVTSNAKALKAEKISGKKKASINKKKQDLSNQLETLYVPDIILPTFSLTTDNIKTGMLLSIRNADVSYKEGQPILKKIHFSLNSRERAAIKGSNASGKSTLLKAMLRDNRIVKTGEWELPRLNNIGYLDQHYSSLNPNLSVMEHMKDIRSDWSDVEIRQQLSRFLFRKNSEVNQLTQNLSGGEKARLSLAIIAAKTPPLLILDEISNNLDLETKEHVIQALKEYPGAMILISHDEEFIESLRIDCYYHIKESSLQLTQEE